MSLVIAAAQSASAPGDIAGNVERHLRFCRLAARCGAQLLIFPELSLTGYELTLARSRAVRPDSPALDPLRQLAQSARMTIVAGAPLEEDARGGEPPLHIASFALRPDGSVLTHTKAHVHPSEQPPFTAGPGGPAWRAGEATVALAICFDATHAAHAASAAALGASVYAVSVMIDESGYARKAPLLEAYARDHRMAVLMANYSGATGGEISAGGSAVWSEEGRVVARSEGAGEALVIGSKAGGVWSGAVLPVD